MEAHQPHIQRKDEYENEENKMVDVGGTLHFD